VISIIPALQFTRSLVGKYHSVQAPEEQIAIRACGYGQLFEQRIGDKTLLAGTIGACGDHVEMCALVGLPNVVHFDGRLLSDTQIEFLARGVPIGLELHRTADRLILLLTVDGKLKVEKLLIRVESYECV
jgi:hypothetical protein